MKFNPLAYIMPPEETKFYDFFNQNVEVCKQVANLFEQVMQEGLNDNSLVLARELKHKSNAILKQTLQELNSTFITPIEREDIQSIAIRLNKITKKMVKVCKHLKVYRIIVFTDNMKKQAETLQNAVKELEFIIKHFNKSSDIKVITESNLRMKEIESHGDSILYAAMDELFSGKYKSLDVLKLRDIHKDIETALDSCFSISDQIVNIVFKQN